MYCKSNCFDVKEWFTEPYSVLYRVENKDKILTFLKIEAQNQNNLTYKTCTEHTKLTDNMLSRFGLIDERLNQYNKK